MISGRDDQALRARMDAVFTEGTRTRRSDPSRLENLSHTHLPLAARLNRVKGSRTLVLRVAGAQGAGKSTLSEFFPVMLHRADGYRVAAFSIDDRYLSQVERRRLAARVYPLIRTRGSPGTRSIQVGLSLTDRLTRVDPDPVTRIPVFDKAQDERRPERDWQAFDGPADIIRFEGWCVGAKPQLETEGTRPFNGLWAAEDPHGAWRCYVKRNSPWSIRGYSPLWLGRSC